ncbi:hypothetical protein [Olleya namhaensis]|uniref:hypothetical protein n=1 Tax=Olleya namhaensis TaxID=1144750 RepID=UPI002491E129|nr:hypothetical protein [Olleya namhaensis]
MLNRLLFISIVLLFFSCGNEKLLELPEIQNADITEVLDVSPAYIFYDETKQDSVELNRKNLIISTNWLFNVDKRLTLEQALPSIIKLQEKKRNATMHKNEKARNYYTCNDTSIKNLGFIDFTDVEYNSLEISKNKENGTTHQKAYQFNVIVQNIDNIIIQSYITVSDSTNSKKLNTQLKSCLNKVNLNDHHGGDYFAIHLSFNRNLRFQDYISLKSILSNFKSEKTVIDNSEFIY